LNDDGWTTVYYGHQTLWVSTTLASESTYECRYCAVNAQGAVSEPSPVLSFATQVHFHRPSTPAPSQCAFSRLPSLPLSPGLCVALAQHRLSKAAEALLHPRNAADVFTVECTGDICVGDTVVMTERLYYKDSRGPHHNNGDGPAPEFGELYAPGAFIGERTIAAHVVKDNYRSARDGLASLRLGPRDVRKFGPHRRLWLEVVWQRSSHEACRPYELKVRCEDTRTHTHTRRSFAKKACSPHASPSLHTHHHTVRRRGA
jgi:hypothetical protein